MDDQRLGRTIRILRQRRGWRQVDLAARSRVSQSAVSDMERGRADKYTLATIRLVLRSLDAAARLDVIWGGRGDLDRLLDADHARLVQVWAERHLAAGWEVWHEASYSFYGERGRIDQLAFHRPTATLEVAEVKTGIWDLQETIGLLDTKLRIAPRIIAQREWRPRRVMGALVLLDGATVRRRVASHAALFSPYDLRGSAVGRLPPRPRQRCGQRGAGLHFPAAYQSRRA